MTKLNEFGLSDWTMSEFHFASIENCDFFAIDFYGTFLLKPATYSDIS